MNSPTKNKNGLSPSKALPVYSDFSHMSAKQGIGGIRFAVSLREDNPDEMIARVFPMTRIIPGIKKEKTIRKVEKKIEEKICSRPDCSARKDKLNELKVENNSLKTKLKQLEDKIETTRNKIALTEKSIIMAEEKNDTMNGQIEEAQIRIFAIETEVEKSETFNITLRKQLEKILQDIDRIKADTQKEVQALKDMDTPNEMKLIFSKDNTNKDNKLVSEVMSLSIYNNEDDDSD